jgi:drug/metabolite transporter (DMT)-like permease
MQNLLLYGLTSLIWGSTWLAIKFQLGVVDPEMSIVYRFGLAAVLLLGYSLIRRLPMRFTAREHAFIALQGLTLFSLNYIMVYIAELHITSGLVAIVFSLIIVFNVALAGIFLGDPIRPRVVLGGVFGIFGLALVFLPELSSLDLSGSRALGLGLSLAGTASASIGNIVAARNQRNGLPIVQTNAYGMAYGGGFTLIVALARGASFGFEPTFSYIASLAYLAVFGSVIAFGGYLTILSRIGPDRAAYITVIFPIVALILSTLFEGLRWELTAGFGVTLVIIGNAIALTRRRAAIGKPELGEVT